MSDRKARIAGAFDRAEAYDAHARIQRLTADHLAAAIANRRLALFGPALEIGCGTGFLTEALLAALPGLALTATDLAPEMVRRTRDRIGDQPGLDFAVLDGEHPGARPPGGWQLIASSLAFQWFEHPAAAIARLAASLAPGGLLAITLLAAGSFAEWRKALGGDDILRDWPDEAALHALCPIGFRADITIDTLVDTPSDGRTFLRELKAIGAATPWNGHASPARLRRAIAAFEAGGSRVTYRVARVMIEAPEGL